MNESRTFASDGTKLTQPGSRPVRYRLLNKYGSEICRNTSAAALAEEAKRLWPDQEQDETRSGAGWDIEVCA